MLSFQFSIPADKIDDLPVAPYRFADVLPDTLFLSVERGTRNCRLAV